MKNFDWNDLRGFLAVVRAGRLTTAARGLSIDHSTLSRQIGRLEASLQTRLFDRHPSGYVLTNEGEWLVKRAEEIESLTIGIQTKMSDRLLGLTGSVRIGAPEGFGTYFLAPRIGRFSSTHRDLEIELIANQQVVRLSAREAEMAVVNIPPKDGRLHSRKLTDYEMGLYASRAYLDCHPPIKTRSDIRNHPFVSYIPDLLPTIAHAYLNEVAEDVVPTFRTSNILTQIMAAREGAGLCMLPHFMAVAEPNLVCLFPQEIRVRREFWLLVHSDLRQTVRVRAVSDFLIREVNGARNLFLPRGTAADGTAGAPA